jgi:hypothetical protein
VSDILGIIPLTCRYCANNSENKESTGQLEHGGQYVSCSVCVDYVYCSVCKSCYCTSDIKCSPERSACRSIFPCLFQLHPTRFTCINSTSSNICVFRPIKTINIDICDIYFLVLLTTFTGSAKLYLRSLKRWRSSARTIFSQHLICACPRGKA